MAEILLVYPSSEERLDYWKAPPIRLYYIDSFLKQNTKHSSQVIDLRTDIWDIPKLCSILEETKIKIVLFDTTYVTAKDAFRDIKILRREHPDSFIGISGFSASGGRGFFKHGVDFIIGAEPENPVMDLLNAVERKQSYAIPPPPGILFKKCPNEFTQAVPIDINSLPFPFCADIFDIELYYKESQHKILPIRGSKGCTNGCDFCYRWLYWGKTQNRRLPKSISKEIEYDMENFDVQSFMFVDETFTLDKKWAWNVAETISRHEPFWKIETRADLVDDKLLAHMSKCGCSLIFYGFESPLLATLENIGKRYRQPVQRIISNIERTPQFEITTLLSLMMGFPHESEDDMKNIIGCIERFRIAGCTVDATLPFPLPGTPYYERNKNAIVRIDEDDLEDTVYTRPSKFIVSPQKMSKAQLLDYFHLITHYCGNNCDLRLW